MKYHHPLRPVSCSRRTRTAIAGTGWTSATTVAGTGAPSSCVVPGTASRIPATRWIPRWTRTNIQYSARRARPRTSENPRIACR
ncbi:hypothetical protein WY02_16270 [Pseudonocardia sp. AL041005-10]|nr:hypothetical protein WY02_16270 [Pseudonocardia sp. AL041005-10]